jgi:hypothetical protein
MDRREGRQEGEDEEAFCNFVYAHRKGKNHWKDDMFYICFVGSLEY